MEELIKQIDVYKNLNNINGIFRIGETKYFFKILNDDEFIMEKEGYDLLKAYYSISQMITYDKENNLVVYKYNEINKDNEGLLTDYFRKREHIDKDFEKVFKDYKKVFRKTITKTKKGNCKIFFEGRLHTRLKTNLENKLVKKYEGKTLIINGNTVKIETLKLKDSIYQYFNNLKEEWCIISNGDPNELNICEDGSVFDYTAGGYIPLMCEFAVLSWYTLIQGEYYSLKYNEKALKNHKKILERMNKVTVKDNAITQSIRDIRYEAVEYYAKNIIEPILNKLDYKNWYIDYKNYFAMKLLAVFIFNNISEVDVALIIGYFNLLYKNDVKTIDELLELLKQIFLGGKNE